MKRVAGVELFFYVLSETKEVQRSQGGTEGHYLTVSHTLCDKVWVDNMREVTVML